MTKEAGTAADSWDGEGIVTVEVAVGRHLKRDSRFSRRFKVVEAGTHVETSEVELIWLAIDRPDASCGSRAIQHFIMDKGDTQGGIPVEVGPGQRGSTNFNQWSEENTSSCSQSIIHQKHTQLEPSSRLEACFPSQLQLKS